MAKTKISEFSSTPANNTDIDSINIAEGCAPSGINDAIRELMAQLKDFQTGAAGDSFNGPVGTTTAAAGAFTTLAASGAVTLSGGTANGVAYLNGSKVLTTGSALVFDGSNLGLGVTPSAWGSLFRAFQFGPNGGSITARTDSNQAVEFGVNWYFDGSTSRYINSNWATRYRQFAGGHEWYTAPSGTAGNAISFTQAMTLSSGGFLGVGVTSPNNYLAVGINTVNTGIDLQSTSNGGTFARFGLVGPFGTNNDTYIGSVSNNNFLFYTNNTERARIDTSGNLLVGTTSNPNVARIRLAWTTGNFGIESVASANTLSYHMNFANASNASAGNISTTNNSTAYATSSDYRLKKDIAPMTGALAKVAALKPCTYKWKADGSNGQGFIAHELAEVVPDAVIGEKDAVNADGAPKYQGIDVSFLVATLTAALQEAHGLIKDLQARVDALEAK